MIKCHHRNRRGECEIVKQLSGLPFVVDPKACEACVRTDKPRAINAVTSGCAVAAASKAGREIKPSPHLEQRRIRLSGRVGTRLKSLIPSLLESKSCNCSDYANKMDRWGVGGCEIRYQQIVNHLVEQSRQNAITKNLPDRLTEWQAKRWLDKAIRLEKQELDAILPDNGDWFVAVTTAPRQDCTLRACVGSMVRAGWTPSIFAEPNTDLTGIDVPVIRNDQRLGVWHNWLRSVKYGLQTDAKYILTVQDDSLFHPDSRKFTESILWPSPDAGFVSLYTPKHYSIVPRKKTMQRPPGVNRIATRSLWGACAFVMPREVAEQVVSHKIATSWYGAGPRRKRRERHSDFAARRDKWTAKRKREPWRIQNSDTAIGKLMKATNRSIWFVDPSPVQHIAKHSAAGHGGNDGRRNCLRCANHSVPLSEQVPVNFEPVEAKV